MSLYNGWYLAIYWVLLISHLVAVRFSQSTYSVDEDDGPAQPVLILSNPSSTNITVRVRSNDITATGEYINININFNDSENITGRRVDYYSGKYTVIFPAGVTSVPFDVPINNDALYEGNESFNLTIIRSSVPSNVGRINPSRATVTILDDEGNFMVSMHC